MGTLRRHLQHCVVLFCLSVAGASGAQQRGPVPSSASWAPGTDYLARCDFNNNSQPFCDWTQTCGTSQGTWIRTKHATPTPGTGPEGDYPDGKGHFIYQEASNLVPFDTNRLESPELVVSGELCIDFWYHMLGLESQNELKVIILVEEEEEEESLVWSRRGNQSSAWLYGFTSLHFWRETHVKVAFEAVRGFTEYGDSAVDNVAVWRGPCTASGSSSSSTPTASATPTELPEEGATTPGSTTTTVTPTTSTAPATTTPVPISWGSCSVSGDPHYYTFDQQTHHFMGNCTYTLSQLCGPDASLPYFNVEAANEHRGGNTRVSYVRSVTVEVHGLRILLEKGRTVQVNGEQEAVPSTPAPGVHLSASGFYTVVSADFGLRVRFDGDHQVEVTLPSPYRGRVCGLCGNYNGNPGDDFLNPAGEQEPDSTRLGNSWQVGNLTSCSTGSGSDPPCTEEEKEVARSSAVCGLLTDAAGPFRDCHGTLDPTSHLTSCLYDQCELHLDPDALCKSLQSYADACRSLGAPVEPWRNDSFCPMPCPGNSHYESCTSPCPATCVDPTAATTCSLPCVEACSCDSGFLLNNGKCVPHQECGCWHEGKHYPVGSAFWTDDTCSSQCKCPSPGGTLRCSPESCPKDTFCGIQDGAPGCYPETFGICRVHNDPHYNTFDKVTLHFMGTCTYTLARLCANATLLPFFNVEAKNENRGHTSVSYVQRVLVEVYGQRIEMVKKQPSHVLVNQVWTTLPISWANGSLAVSRSGRYVTLETDFRLTVSYDTDHTVEIRLPTAYADRACGLCGNFNSRPQDDYMKPDGEQATNTNELGNSWRVAGADLDDPDCDPREPEPCTAQQEELYKADHFCGLLTSPEGPFAACHGVINPEAFFESCLFDLCALHGSQQALCNALGTYWDACQRAGVSLPSWRNATFCGIPCAANSDYNPCASACPATCSDPLAPRNCSRPCVEDCECREGFMLSGGRCVSVADCGCVEGGHYYEKEETFWAGHCERRCRCVGNGTLDCREEACPPEQICKVQNGILGCFLPDVAHCHVYGDPHYVTFDGRLYHFQGACNYTAVESCSNASQQFSVTTRNEHRGSPAWTALHSVAVSLPHLHIALRRNREVYVNGVRVPALPVKLPQGVEVEERPPYVVLRSPFGLRVTFDGDQELFVQVDERHKGHLCGLCGTYSGSQLDDFRRPDGILEHDPDAFGHSWRVADDPWVCAPPGPEPAPCNSTQETVYQELCQGILSSTGPFATCHWSIPPQLYFESCVYDQCATEGHPGQLCQSLGAYAAACQLAGLDLGEWWKETVCAAPISTSAPEASTAPTGLPGEAPSTFPPEPPTPSVSTPEPAPSTFPPEPPTPSVSTPEPAPSTFPPEPPTPSVSTPEPAPSTFPPEPPTPSVSTPEPGPPTTCDFSCSFDENFCSWTQSASDSVDWTRHRGPTPSPTTGPSFDHTTGGGYFIYLKGTEADPGDVAHLLSPTCLSHGAHCLRFWYHMYGVARTMALRVYVVSGGTAPVLLWSQAGNHGDRWLEAEVSVPHSGRLQVLLEGVRGEDFRSDIAMDDISLTSGCSGATTPGSTTTTVTPTTSTAPITTTPVPISWGSCSVSGDPHYYTFDQQTHHFMGNCTYTLSQLCGPDASLPYFNVEAANEHRGGNTRVSYVRSVTVEVHGLRILLEKGRTVQVNGEQEAVPSTPAPGLHISASGFYTVVSADFGLRVRFDGDHQVEVTLPSPYRGRVCGLCGNYNGNPGDDFLNPAGEQEPDSTRLGNSWQVGNLTSCSTGSGSDPPCTEEEKEVARSSAVCGLLTDAAGPFRDCHGTLDPTSHLASCLYDQCELHLDPDALCKSLQSYADACRSLGAPVEPWRNDSFCPMPCPGNSHYESCTSPCPATCVDPTAATTCSLPCVEACSCDSGFLLNNGKCVPHQECGCWHEGKHYPVGSAFWTDDTCSSQCKCPSPGGTLRCSPESCPKDTFCGIQDGAPGCYPETFGICRVHNDPHYNTFDKVTLHFMGTCTYTLARLCANATLLPFFNIEAKNENRGHTSVSYVQRVLVEVYGQRIEMVKNQPSQVLVNQVWTTLPISWANGSLAVSRSGRYVTLETDFRLTVSYDTDHTVEIRLPTAYADRACGLCGNFNSRPQDDYMKPDGEQAKDTNELGNSWRVAGADLDDPDCDPVEPEPCTAQQEELYKADHFCGLLTSPEGPFAACHGVINPEAFFESCLFDLCALHGSQQALCNALGTYSDACQRVGVNLPSWRNSSFCPLDCPLNTHYVACSSACPATCLQPQAPQNCSKPCTEDCACDAGWVLSGGDCVPLSGCGCVHSGQYYNQGEHFVTEDCASRCVCLTNGSMECVAMECGPEEACKVLDGRRGCHPASSATCHVYGDPHYSTFDGRLHHFQGGCNYTLVGTCHGRSPAFRISARNEHRGNPSWTALHSVALSLEGLHISLQKGRAVYINGALAKVPVLTLPGAAVELVGSYLQLNTSLGVKIRFDGDQDLLVSVHEKYRGKVCGLCGTYTGVPGDDFTTPTGALVEDVNEFGNSWREPDALWPCNATILPPDPCPPSEQEAARGQCQWLSATEGPFASCHSAVPPEPYVESCLHDACATGGSPAQLCQLLQSYASACQAAGVVLGDWEAGTPCESCFFNCSFEEGFCSWQQSVADDSDWIRTEHCDGADSGGLGNRCNSSGGHYIYASSPIPRTEKTAQLISPGCTARRPVCFRFRYRLAGASGEGALKVLLLQDGEAEPLLLWLASSGNDTRSWRPAEVDLHIAGRFQILLEGVTGSGNRVELAVDEVSLDPGCCLGDVPAPSTLGPTATPTGHPEQPSTEPPASTLTSQATSTPPGKTQSPPSLTGRATCSASGDPHYTTFDGRVHHFMGICTYTLVHVCHNVSRLPAAFHVSATNELRGASQHVSYINSVHVEAYGSRISLLKNRKVNVNGTRRSLPVFIGGREISVQSSGGFVLVETDFGLRVRFDGNHYVDVSVPPAYEEQLCGLCGNYNQDPSDDNLKPDGQPASDSTDLGDSWLVPDNGSESCPTLPPPECDPELEEEIQRDSACKLITDPTGVFSSCHPSLDPAPFFANCIYDLCLTGGQHTALCYGLQAYASACANAGTCLEWRNATLCPITCPMGSLYQSCGDRCPPSCATPSVAGPCSPLLVEGCFCEEGFLLSGDHCVPENSCGCLDEQDQYRELGESWYMDGACSERCTCERNHSVTCQPWECSVQEKCQLQDGVLGCHPRDRASCHVVGDPHYYTFDKVMLTFLGTCTYTLVRVCDGSSSSGIAPFAISGQNEDRGPRGATYLREIYVDVYGTRVTLQKNKRVLLNNERVYTPVGSRSRGSVAVGNVGIYMVVETDFGLLVKYDGDLYLEISLPSSYAAKVCGLCGNYNGEAEDELLMPNGTLARNVTQFGNSWKVDEDSVAGCLPDTREDLGPPCPPADRPTIEEQCHVLQSGVFAACHSKIKLEHFVQTCIYDMCKYGGMRATLCAIAQAYADACKAEGIELHWRNWTFCPLPCPSNSHYTPCAPPCPPTCTNIYAEALCEKPPGECLEGCACEEGFVLSDDQCVPLSECGCRDKNGTYHKVGESWVTPHCTQKCRCPPGGVLQCQSFGCEAGEVCQLKNNGKYSCKPTGFGKCLVSGDPHYMTFDGLLHHFQGRHTYVVAARQPSAPARLEDFSIEGENKAQAGSGGITFLKGLRITVYNHTVLFGQGKRVVLDGVQTVPPAQPHEGLRLQLRATRIFLETDFGLSVTFDGAENSDITLPNTYKKKVEGLCGNFDGKHKNDFTTPDGSLVKDVDTFGESWRVPVVRRAARARRDAISEEELDALELDLGFTPGCPPSQLSTLNGTSSCGMLADPQGPFRACFPHVPSEPFLLNCLFDMCAEGNRSMVLCRTLEQYVLACQEKGVTMGNWREAASCARQCPPNSQYSPCAPACPLSCADLAAADDCDSPCLEDCECLPGYALSGLDCVPFASCGRTFGGTYYRVGDSHMNQDCSQLCSCTDSSVLSCSRVSCALGEICTVVNATRGCYKDGPCLPNPCLNDGVCVEAGGTSGFSCSCPESFQGPLCDTQKLHPDEEAPDVTLYIVAGVVSGLVLLALIFGMMLFLRHKSRKQLGGDCHSLRPSMPSAHAPEGPISMHNLAFEKEEAQQR
ncbi:IgGFc-binding protein-like isoform X4 [Paroedura picta]|uniref:IgGFc-binding protein-like isoform X4 n=1 Tax=Paroedura picta TaxID=143630 RepID=UPI0040572609